MKMFRRKQVKSFYQPFTDGSSESEQIALPSPAVYNNKVKVHDWQMKELAEPRDHANFFPPKGNLYLSSYKRLGDDSGSELISETKSMLQQIHTTDQSLNPKSRLLNMFSFPLANLFCEEKGDIITFGDKVVDYQTTTDRDFQMSYCKKLPHLVQKEIPKSLYRRTIGYSMEDLEKRGWENKFLDDNLHLHNKIAAIKIQRHKSYDPILKHYTDPHKYIN